MLDRITQWPPWERCAWFLVLKLEFIRFGVGVWDVRVVVFVVVDGDELV